MQYRTHTCNELRLSDAGKQVKLSGWMENVREVSGNLAFIVLRDFYGTTQLVVEDEKILQVFKNLNKESVVCVTGIVRERASKNPKMETGDIEVVPDSVEVLGISLANSPTLTMRFSPLCVARLSSGLPAVLKRSKAALLQRVHSLQIGRAHV